MVTVGEKIRALRKTHDMTMAQLADKADCTQGYISQLERGLVGHRQETIEKIAEVFAVSPSLLLDQDVDVEKLTEISEILSSLVRLPPKKLAVVRQMIEALDE